MLNLLAVNKDTLLKSLGILWKGLLAIFVVVAIVIAVTYILKYFVTKIDESKKKNTEENAPENSEGQVLQFLSLTLIT